MYTTKNTIWVPLKNIEILALHWSYGAKYDFPKKKSSPALIKVSGGGGSIKSKCNKSSMPMDFNINLHNDGGRLKTGGQ